MGYCALMDRDGVGVHKLAKKNEADIYGLLITCEVKMAVFWPIRKKKELNTNDLVSFFRCIVTILSVRDN